jgi:hypothetical protein
MGCSGTDDVLCGAGGSPQLVRLLENNTGVATQKLLILWVQKYLIACLLA